MARHTKEFYVAMDAFLASEAIRHQEDIDAINAKRKLLADLGYSSEEPAPWINDEDIEPQDDDGYIRVESDDSLTYIW